jgi:hypothetical protein
MKKPRPDIAQIKTKTIGDAIGGLPCPKCGNPIEMTLESLLAFRSFQCRKPGCGTVLRLDSSASRTALNALQGARRQMLK